MAQTINWLNENSVFCMCIRMPIKKKKDLKTFHSKVNENQDQRLLNQAEFPA